MHSRKSIIKRSIIFVMGVFAFAFFSFTKVNAASCEVVFNDQNQYITIGGDVKSWADGGIKLSDGCSEWSNLKVDSLLVNGVTVNQNLFTTEGKASGHYTIGYNYSYFDGTNTQTGVIYRYLRILNSSLDTSNNYTLGTFDFADSYGSNVVDSYYLGSNYFANFISYGNSTYIVIKDSLARTVENGVTEIKHGTYALNLKNVVKEGTKYYLVGNNSENQGVLLVYDIEVISEEPVVAYTNAYSLNDTRVYNDAYIYKNGGSTTTYLVGKNSSGYPLVDKLEGSTITTVYTYENIKGSYNGVIVQDQVIYAVGYTKADGAILSSGLYTYVNISDSSNYSQTILDTTANTVFNDVAYDSKNSEVIIVGESTVNQIYANNVLAATNIRQGYSDGVILRVSLDGKTLTGAYMLGGNVNDTFTNIKSVDENTFVVTGTSSDGVDSLIYTLDKNTFEVTEDKTSLNSNYKINGIVKWDNGYAYYGNISSSNILGVYNPVTVGENYDALFLVLDNRTFTNYQAINLIVNSTVKYCETAYKLGFAGTIYGSVECENDENALIETSVTGTSKIDYVINLTSGPTIYIYRVVNVTAAPTPVDLTSSNLGILKWHVYNRSSVYVNDNSIRYETTDFNYRFAGDVHKDETIEDMIDVYFETGSSRGYSLSYVSSGTEYKTFVKSNQTNAAFASVEYAKKFAYYQEFSRVIRMDGSTSFDKLGAVTYYNQVIGTGNPYYIYYIDYRGANSDNNVGSCMVTASSVTNCAAKGGYAFSNLDSIKSVIELFLNYNNYFVTTRNTIYNGSVAASEIDAYKQTLTTDEYVKANGFANTGTNLTFNVANKDGSVIYYQGTNKNVYFGGSVDDKGNYTHSLVAGTQTVTSNESSGITYYSNDSNVFFAENMCYSVYYSYVDGGLEKATGTSRVFCLDTKAPVIEYKKDNFTSTTLQSSEDVKGTSSSNPLYIEDAFKIVNLIDLDEYAFIQINGNRYPNKCDNSQSCLNDVAKYINQRFEYNKEDPVSPVLVEFSDRMSNKISFYFVVGTKAPTIDVVNESLTGFTLVIDFNETNPIKGVEVAVYQQACTGEANQGCYTPNISSETIKLKEHAITEFEAEFEEALANYIYAVGYRDNNSEYEKIIVIEQNEGIYEIIHPFTGEKVNYVIEENYFVELDGTQEKYPIDGINIFTYDGTDYRYDEVTNTIQAVTLVDGEYVSNGGESITLLNNTFKFSEDGKEYTITTTEEGKFVEAVTQKYEIVENSFEIDGLVFEYNPEDETISYENPDITGLKHIELTFLRTIDNNGVLEGGVYIPKTQPIEDVTIDPYTGLPAYEIVEDEYVHFNLVDGVYTFLISQNFPPYNASEETKINVKNLDLKIGYSINNDGLTVISNKLLDFEKEEDTSVNLAIKEIFNEFSYPLPVEEVASDSRLLNFRDTQFIDKAVYVSYTEGSTGVFIIDVYKETNEYGLPKDDSTKCEKIVIYADTYESNPITSEEGCKIVYSSTVKDLDATILAKYGITQVLSDKTAFAFNGQGIFYNIYLKAFIKNNDGLYIPSATTIDRKFYIDDLDPNYNDGVNGSSVTSYVYNGSLANENTVVSFDGENNIYSLSQPVGNITNVAFMLNWFTGTTNDFRENKLLLININSGSDSQVCNLYKLLTDDTYSVDGCQKYIDLENSNDNLIVFSKTGNYSVKFFDASGNNVVYNFVIDKTAPGISVNNVIIQKNGEDNYIGVENKKGEYYVLEYVKGPETNLTLTDLTIVTNYCYYFSYNSVKYGEDCVNTNTNEVSIKMNDTALINALNEIDDLVTLYVWAIDSLNNNGEDAPTKIHFWVDYKKPIGSAVTTNLNTSNIDVAGDATLTSKTISIISGQYSGQEFTCNSEEGFSFVDSRYTTTLAPYTFVFNCSDTHGHEGDDFPESYITSGSFDNTMKMKFYESSDGVTKGDIFNFGLPTVEGDARWIYITVEDVVGNESDYHIVLPIMIYDSVAPYVVKGEKTVLDENLNPVVKEITPILYAYPGGEGQTGNVYLANNKVVITLSEPIAQIKTCKMFVGDASGYTEKECSDSTYGDGFSQGQLYSYSNNKTIFEISLKDSILNTTKSIIFNVVDFAGLESGNIIVVIDKIAPNILFTEEGKKDDVIEYITDSDVYGASYINTGHSDHIEKSDDQGADIYITVKYYIYEPTLTFNNYVYNAKTGKYSPIANNTKREINAKYYLLLNSSLLKNKKCDANATQTIAGVIYCFVEDTQSFYYFDSKLEDESGNFFKEITGDINSSKIGVYRISYYATDYAGNISETIYRKVFVNDTVNPDIDLYNTGDVNDSEAKPLYRNVATENTDNFEGKLNKSIAFKGTDSALDANTRIVLYRCPIDKYEEGTCKIDQPLFSSDTNGNLATGISTSNTYSLGSRLTGGVYKAFVYDKGNYQILEGANNLYYDSGVIDSTEKVYSLTHNDSSFYFAIVNTEIDASYVINGNKYTSSYSSGKSTISFNESKVNYYTITNGSAAADVILKRYDYAVQDYVDISGSKAIGYQGAAVIFDEDVNNGIVTVTYKDNLGREIYVVKYEEYYVSDGLYLHKTYHKVDITNKTVEVCKYISGKNQCQDLEKVYQVQSVTANIYEEGSYILKMADRYGNLSQDMEELTVDNTAYTENKNNNKATGINYWFSVPSAVTSPSNLSYFEKLIGVDNSSDINVLDDRYENNFNSSFFYAFASKADALKYLDQLYRNDIKNKGAEGYVFYKMNGDALPTTKKTVDDVLSEINEEIKKLVFTTFTAGNSFSDSEILQVPYEGSKEIPLSSNMYKYAYLLVTKNVSALGKVTYTHEYMGDSCSVSDNTTQQCVKVNLKIVNVSTKTETTQIKLNYDSTINSLHCRVIGTGGSGELSGEGCNFATVTSGATYIFIDSDVSKYHQNTVYYGITAYTEDTTFDFNEVGAYIPLSEIDRYKNESGEYSEDDNGNYIWLNSKWVELDKIINTNLFVNVCTFNGSEANNCIYTSFFSRYSAGAGSSYIPSSTTGDYYYDYFEGDYVLKSELITRYNVYATYYDDGRLDTTTNAYNVPVSVNNATIEAKIDIPVVRRTNKKAYIKLFDDTSAKKFFEVNAIKDENGKYSEVYSYATLQIKIGNNEYEYKNINDYLRPYIKDYSYECIIDINYETAYSIIIKDRAGNTIEINISHSSIIPTITYSKVDESTTSGVNININTESNVSNIAKNYVTTYKYIGNEFVESLDTACIKYEQDISNSDFVKVLTLNYKYNSAYHCSGTYRVYVTDSHGNSNYKDFVFNPYDLNTEYIIDSSDNNYEYMENEISGLIVNKSFDVNIDASLNYIVIKKYDSYSNLNLTNEETLTIKDFARNYEDVFNNSCDVIINKIEGDIYRVTIADDGNHSCDGIYVIDVYNRFSEEIINSQFKDLEGADKEVAISRVVYNGSSTIEIDTTAPSSDLIGTDSYFDIYVDEQENIVDTQTLITNKTIAYTNKFITVAWGGYKEHSFAFLKYRVKTEENPNPDWTIYSEGVTYGKDYNASQLFKQISTGTYTYEFIFIDAVGNEDISKVLTIVITIKAPEVAFYEVFDDPNVVGRQYEYGERIADRTILKCLSSEGSGTVIAPCELNQYNYTMVINGETYPAFSLERLDLQGIISRGSWWMYGTAAQYAEELSITLTVSVVGKSEINTELSVIIDKKAPLITIDGNTIGTTYVGDVVINISREDQSNEAEVYYCDAIIEDKCKVYDRNKNLIDGGVLYTTIERDSTSTYVNSQQSGYFMVKAFDDLGNTSYLWFVLDNEAPEISVTIDNAVIAPNMYTNAKVVFATVKDELSEMNSTFIIEFTPLNSEENSEIVYDPLVGLTKEGKYVLTPKDGVNNEGRSVTFYIYRQAPKYTITTNNEDDAHVVNSEVTVSWKREESELIAPIVSVTVDGRIYNAQYTSEDKKYVGETIKDIGEHTFVITDAAGNRSVIMVTINNTNKVCINGKVIEVKMQAYYNVDDLNIGNEKGVTYEKNDVVIFALPSQVSSGDCASEGLLGYRTLDPLGSNYLIENEKNAELFNQNKYNFVEYGFISQAAINEINNVGGTVVVFVVTKDIANNELGYKVGTNFFMEDPIGWSMIFVSALSLVWPAIRVFVKKKVKVL